MAPLLYLLLFASVAAGIDDGVQVVNNVKFAFWPVIPLLNLTLTGNSSIEETGKTDERRGKAGSLVFKPSFGTAINNCPISFYFFNTSTGLKSGLNFSTVFVFSKFPVSPPPGGYLSFFIAPWDENFNNSLPKNNLLTIKISDNYIQVNIGLKTNNTPLSSSSSSSSMPPNPPLSSSNTEELITTMWIDYNPISTNLEIRQSKHAPFVKPLLPNEVISLVFPNIHYSYVSLGFFANSTSSGYKISGWNFTGSLLLFPNGSKEGSVCQHGFFACQEHALPIVIGASIAVGLGGAAFLVFCLYKRRLETRRFRIPYDILDLPASYTYDELDIATSGFSKHLILGKGAFGTVYKGYLTDYSAVAVKRYKGDLRGAGTGMGLFLAEIGTIGRLRHRNLVALKGWCHDKGELLLVYEFMPKGSLDFLLYRVGRGRMLIWEQRFRILEGLAAALVYLHEEWEQPVLHRDIKPGNVLVDGYYNARLGDFGLARFVQPSSNSTGQPMTVVGTLGYMAPELAITGRATEKSDVYSYGVLALEVATGRAPLDDDVTLLERVWLAQENGDLLSVVDHRLGGKYDADQLYSILHVGLLCCHPDPQYRPSMRFIQQVLRRDIPLSNKDLPASRPVPFYYSPE